MLRLMMIGGLILPFCVGCSNDTYDRVTGEYLTVLSDLISVCNKVEDKETAKKHQPRIAELVGQLKQLHSRLEELGEVDPDTKSRIERKYKNRFEELGKEFPKAMAKVETEEAKKVLDSELKSLARMMAARLY